MIKGKALKVFAATLILASSISFAAPGGAGTNNTSNAPTDGASNPAALFPHIQTTETLPDGSTENVSIGMETATTEVEAEQLGGFVNNELKKNVEAGGRTALLIINPDQPARDWLAKSVPYTTTKALAISEKELGKTWNDRANEFGLKVSNQIRPDGKFNERLTKFKNDYKEDVTTFYRRGSADGKIKPGKGFDKFNITISLIRMTLNSSIPFLVAVVSHGFHNVAPHVAFLPFLIVGMTSGTVFTYLSPFIPWNRDLPRLSDSTFWKTADYLIQETLYYVSEGLFVDVFRGAQKISNRWALSRKEIPQFNVMTEKQNWGLPSGIALVSTGGQSPFDVSFGTQFIDGNKKEDARLLEHPELAPQVEAAKKKLLNMLALKGTIVSVLITIAGLVGGPHSFISEVGFTGMYASGFVTFALVFDLPGKFAAAVESIRDYFTPESIKLPRFTKEEMLGSCNMELSGLSPEPLR